MIEKEYLLNNPIILFGTGRSGTTLFMNALFRHEDLAFFSNFLERKPEWMWLNYLRFLTDNSYYRFFPDQVISPFDKIFLKPVEGYSIWEHIVGNEVDFSRSFLDDINPSVGLKKEVNGYIGELLNAQNRSRFALKITGPGRLRFLKHLFPDAHFIWLRRDFIPTLHSFLKIDFWENRSTKKLWWKSPKIEKILDEKQHIQNDPVLFTAFQLQAIILDIEQLINEENIKVLKIDYEKFVQNPKIFIDKTIEFCSLSFDPDCYKFIDNNRIENRNKKKEDYFNREELINIQKLRDSLTEAFGEFLI